ncbi:MAG: hypothetical protein HBSIN02_18330 [Bacteroidia bacterium]|nr:MAG: hypothetical protein HBSIN02_18330 [Bacteroidia bacterium]
MNRLAGKCLSQSLRRKIGFTDRRPDGPQEKHGAMEKAERQQRSRGSQKLKQGTRPGRSKAEPEGGGGDRNTLREQYSPR